MKTSSYAERTDFLKSKKRKIENIEEDLRNMGGGG